MRKLKPCPNCGYKAQLNKTSVGFSVSCINFECKIGTIDQNWTKKAAIEIWNQRQDGWISVDVRTPNYEESTQLDVFIDGKVGSAWWEPKNKLFAFTHGMVTHWRPKPQPPTTSTPPTPADD